MVALYGFCDPAAEVFNERTGPIGFLYEKYGKIFLVVIYLY